MAEAQEAKRQFLAYKDKLKGGVTSDMTEEQAKQRQQELLQQVEELSNASC